MDKPLRSLTLPGLPDTYVIPEAENGKSAYELAVQEGFEGSLDDWLASLKGDPGTDFTVKAYYESLSALESAVPTPADGDVYGVGTSAPYDIYVWDAVHSKWVNNGQIQGPTGATGPYFTPSVSENGDLSWTNDGGLPNPPSVNLKGPEGEPGKYPEPFYVNCTIPEYDETTDEITHDKTYDEILAAWQNGRPCYAILKKAGETTTSSNILRLTTVIPEDYVEFTKTSSDAPDTPNILTLCDIMIYANGGAEGIWTMRMTASSSKELLPSVTASDNGKFLRVVNGAWAKASISNANGGSLEMSKTGGRSSPQTR